MFGLSGLLASSNLVWLALAGPVVFFYLLKIRRKEQRISTLFLWRQVHTSARVDSFWQRLRNQLFLWLHLIILLGLVLALCRPYRTAAGRLGKQVAIIVDQSASMSANCEGGQKSRFAVARSVARHLVEQAPSGTQFLLAGLSQSPRIVLPLETDRNRIFDAIDSLEWEALEVDSSSLLPLARSVVHSNPHCQVIVLTDQAGGWLTNQSHITVVDCSKYGEMTASAGAQSSGNYQKDLNNVAIDAFEVRPSKGSSVPAGENVVEAFVLLKSYSQQAETFTVQILQKDRVLASKSVSIAAGERQSFALEMEAEPEDQRFQVQLIHKDGLDLDNVAYCVSGGSAVLMLDPTSKVPPILQPALACQPLLMQQGTQDTRDFKQLHVWQQWPSKPEAGFHLVVLPGKSETAVDYQTSTSEEVAGLPLGELFGATPAAVDPQKLSEEAWTVTPWLLADDKPVVAHLRSPSRQVLVFASELESTNLPIHPALPILVGRFLEILSSDQVHTLVQCGSDWRWNQRNDATLRWLQTPSGRLDVPSGLTESRQGSKFRWADDKNLHYRPTRPGLYQAVWADSQGHQHQQDWAASYRSAAESDLSKAAQPPEHHLPAAKGPESNSDSAATSVLTHEYWPYVVMLTLLVFLAEWWLFFRPYRAWSGSVSSGRGSA